MYNEDLNDLETTSRERLLNADEMSKIDNPEELNL